MDPEMGAGVEQDQRGAFRSASLKPLCKVCSEEASASSACARCGACFCDRHTVMPGERCPDCEEIYVLLEQERRHSPISRWHLGLGYTASAALMLLLAQRFRGHIHDFPILLTAFVLLSLWPLWFSLLRRRLVRKRFLAEAPGRPKHLPRKAPVPAPRDKGEREREVSIIAFVLACLVFVPLLSQAGLMLGIVHVYRMRNGGAGRGLAVGAIAVGLAGTLAQLMVLVLLLR